MASSSAVKRVPEMKKTVLYNTVCDVTNFKHPGGTHIIAMMANRDATVLFEQYHTAKATLRVVDFLNNTTEENLNERGYLGMKVLSLDATKDPDYNEYRKYSVGNNKTSNAAFWLEVQQRAEAHLEKHYTKDLHKLVSIADNFVTGSLIALGYLLCWFAYNTVWEILGIASLGYGVARAGFLMHHGNHQSSWPGAMGNYLIGLWIDFVGGYGLLWQMEHNVGHHVDPNNEDWDPDTLIGHPIMRLNYYLERKWWHRYQWIYVPLMIAVGLIKWTLEDIEMYYTHARTWLRPYGKPVGMKTESKFDLRRVLTPREIYTFWACKIGLVVFRLAIPYVLIGNMSIVLRQLFLSLIMASYCLEMIFIVNHNLAEAHLGLACNTGKSMHWATAQMLTTANWKSGSKFYNFLAGGLNHQIEHHLFPRVYFYFYYQLSPIVKEVALKHGLPYYAYPSYFSILRSSLTHLENLGKYDNNPDEPLGKVKVPKKL